MDIHRKRISDSASRRSFIGGSDARVIMGQDEKALIRLWQEKRGEIGPEDLSTNLIVQLGVVTEDLNRQWYERNTGNAIKDVQCRVLQRVHTGGTYFRLLGRSFRTRNPSPPSFSERNSMPASSNAPRILFTASSETCRRSFSKSTTVDRPNAAVSASCDWVMSNKARAARHCAGVI
jgi:hypothetical protein